MKIKLLCILLYCLLPLSAEIFTMTGDLLIQGAINGTDLSGQTLDITLEFNDGLTFQEGILDVTGQGVSLTLTIGGVDFVMDNPDANGLIIDGGTFNIPFSITNLATFSSEGDFGGTRANDNESLSDYIARVGNTFSSGVGSNFNSGITFDGGTNVITTNIAGTRDGRTITVASNASAVPEPSTYALLAFVFGFFYLRSRKN